MDERKEERMVGYMEGKTGGNREGREARRKRQPRGYAAAGAGS